MTEELTEGLRKSEIERTLKKAGWTVHKDDYYKTMKKDELIETKRNAFREVAELKDELDACKFAMAMSEKVEKELNKKIADLVKVRTDDYMAWSRQDKLLNKKIEQLEQAKEIIKKFLLWENDWHEKTESKYELLKQAEQFLKESE